MIRRSRGNFYDNAISNTRQSVEYWPNQLESWYRKFFDKKFLYNEHGSLKSEVHMFYEDIKINLFPSIYRNKKFISISGDEITAKKVRHALDIENHDLSDALWSFIDKNWVIFNLLAYGKCYFEIVYNENGDFVFESINPEGVFRLTKNHIYQYIPKLVRTEGNLPVFKKLNSQNIFCIKLSTKIKKKLRGVLRELADLSSNLIMPKFAHDELVNNSKFSAFDQSWYYEKGCLRIAKITKDIGWSCRTMLDKYVTEYYTLDKRLKFNQFLIEFRTCIIEGLNKGIKKINLTDWNCPEIQIIADATMTENDVLEVEKLLKNGSVSFHDIFLMSRRS